MSRAPSGDVPTVGQTIGKFTILVELGRHAPPTFAARAAAIGSADPELVVIQSIAPSAASAAENDTFVRRARRLAQTRHPNVCRVREVVVTRDRIVVASDFVDGETLAELLMLDAKAETKRFGLAEQLRILVDVLSGMSSIHLAPRLSGERDKNDSPLFHGAIHPRNIVVGADGSSRLIRAVRAPRASNGERPCAIEEPRYAAPEILLGDATAGTGVDIYAVGVLLWEALSSTPLFTDSGEKEVLARQLAGPLPPATPPTDHAWASSLVEVAARALEVDPEKRFSSTAELAGALRLAVQAQLAATSRVGNAVTATASAKIAERKGRLRAAKKPAPRVIATAAATTKTALPSGPDDIEVGPATKRMHIDSIADADLEITDDEAVDSKWSSAPPTKKPSIAPPLPTRALPSAQPPPLIPEAIAPLPPPPMFEAIAPPLSADNLETVAPVVSQAHVTPAISTPLVPSADASDAVAFTTGDDRPRRRRMIVVFGMVGIAAVILLIAGVKHIASGPAEQATPATAAPTTPLTTAPTSAAPPVVMADPPPTVEPVAQPFDATHSQPVSTSPMHDPTPHAVTPPKPAHKKPPHSSYEPEGI